MKSTMIAFCDPFLGAKAPLIGAKVKKKKKKKNKEKVSELNDIVRSAK